MTCSIDLLYEQYPHDLRLKSIHFLFTAARLKQRLDEHCYRLFADQDGAMCRAMRKVLGDVLEHEFVLIRERLSAYRMKKMKRRKIAKPRKRTAYSVFCEKMREQRSYGAGVGINIQLTWQGMDEKEKQFYKNEAEHLHQLALARMCPIVHPTEGGKRLPDGWITPPAVPVVD
jgi:hypothetical protein